MVSPYRALPPLGTLRTFEAVSRNLSFTRAADELALTQSAVSHQIRALEDHLGTRLFRRLHRGIELTVDGPAFLEGVGALEWTASFLPVSASEISTGLVF
jgi:LysR family transcriptional regulator, glycine cleavage system transcriptional activator